MEPEYVAAKVIDGILRNRQEIFVPGRGASIDLFRAYVSLFFTGKNIGILRISAMVLVLCSVCMRMLYQIDLSGNKMKLKNCVQY